MKIIKLTQGKIALVDDSDFGFLNQFKWYARKDRHTFYSQRKFKIDGKWKNIMMHRLIVNPPPHLFVDHINRNGLDNRRKNLRIVTHSQNHFNEKIRTDNSSGHKGVYWHKQNKKWIATIGRKHLGSFDNIEDAIACRETAFSHVFC